MAIPDPLPKPYATSVRSLAVAGLVVLFLWTCSRFYLPGQAFTSLIDFGGKRSAQYIPELRAMGFYAPPQSHGYDAQFYAQIAMHPQLGDPVLRDAVDSLPYRARRILFCWTAYVLGAGNPEWALHVYSVQNIIAWLLLGWVLLRWFPPANWGNVVRWFAVMFTFGLCFSVRNALVDGPSLLLLAVGMVLLEKGRLWWSTIVLGVAGLGKETNILAACVLAPNDTRDWRSWASTALRCVMVVAPLAGWLLCLRLWLGSGADLGARNFDWPFAGYLGKWGEILAGWWGTGDSQLARASAVVHVALTAQWLFFVLRPRWSDPWWRLGAAYAALMVVLGDAVWEGHPGAAARVLLPMTLAFNVLLPRGGRWWLLFVLGNLLVWQSADKLVPPGREDSRVLGSHALQVDSRTGNAVRVRFTDSEWYGLERSNFSYWRWSRGQATITIENPHGFPIAADIAFEIKSSDERNVTLRFGERVLWSGPTGDAMREVEIGRLELAPGDTTLIFETDRPAALPPNGDPRPVAFRVCDLTVTLIDRK